MNHNRTYSGGAEWLVDRIKKNPEGLLLVAAGCALMMRAGTGMPFREHFREHMPQVGAGISRARSQAADYAQSASDRASDYASQVASFASSTAERLRDESGRVVENVRTQASGAVENVMERQPLAIALVGLLAGAAVASAFPATDIERRAMGPLADELKEAGSDLAGRVSEKAQAAADRLKQTAEDQGLDADKLKQAGSEVAQAMTGSRSGQSSKGSGIEGTSPSTPRNNTH